MESPFVTAVLVVIALGIGSMFGPLGILVAGFVLVAIGVSASQETENASRESQLPVVWCEKRP